ncbi:MAG: hypothetical protein IT165_28915 [Bryobacterales bacterium]|nr:hypothetical protein [Bryobacterales bacterium]
MKQSQDALLRAAEQENPFYRVDYEFLWTMSKSLILRVFQFVRGFSITPIEYFDWFPRRYHAYSWVSAPFHLE